MHVLIIQGGSQKLLLASKETIVCSGIFSGPPCTTYIFST